MSMNTDSMMEWAQQAEQYGLPDWEKLPSIPLYMDQVMMFTGEALALFERDENQNLLTSSMINNYVKNGLVEHPVHKKYSREHLSKLMMTSMLKQVLSIQDISVLFSGSEDSRTLYAAFVSAQDNALHETAAQIHPEADESELRAMALRLAAEANARRAVAERILTALSEKKEKKSAEKSRK
ncbi:MAG: DUF1836 domain-containing protein [Hominenteromicrobium sp.]